MSENGRQRAGWSDDGVVPPHQLQDLPALLYINLHGLQLLTLDRRRDRARPLNLQIGQRDGFDLRALR